MQLLGLSPEAFYEGVLSCKVTESRETSVASAECHSVWLETLFPPFPLSRPAPGQRSSDMFSLFFL